MSVKQAIAFLDRDGTLVNCDVKAGMPVPTHGNIKLVDGAAEACDLLRRLGFTLVMVTNQPDIARGTIDRQTVDETNRYIADQLDLDITLTCRHDDLDQCACRKPEPGLLLEASSIFRVELDRSSVMIGDRWRDVDAGIAAGVTTILIDRGYGELLNAQPDYVAPTLVRAAEWIGTHITTRSRNDLSA